MEIGALEYIRCQSIDQDHYYNDKQKEVSKNNIPNWLELIKSTVVCCVDNAPIGFVAVENHVMLFLHVDPLYLNKGIDELLISQVEYYGMKCDVTPRLEHVVMKRKWIYFKDHTKTLSGETFLNKWYIFS